MHIPVSPENRPPQVSDSPPIGRFLWRRQALTIHEALAATEETGVIIKPFSQASYVYFSRGLIAPHVMELGGGLEARGSIAKAYKASFPAYTALEVADLEQALECTIGTITAPFERTDGDVAIHRLHAELQGGRAERIRDERLRLRYLWAGIVPSEAERTASARLVLGNIVLHNPDPSAPDRIAAAIGKRLTGRSVKVRPVTPLERKETKQPKL